MSEFESTDRITVISWKGIQHRFKGRHVERIETNPVTGLVEVTTNRGAVRQFRNPQSIQVGPSYHPTITPFPGSHEPA